MALQADPLTQNRYAFAGGNPVTNVEFDGHKACTGTCKAGEHMQVVGGETVPVNPTDTEAAGTVVDNLECFAETLENAQSPGDFFVHGMSALAMIRAGGARGGLMPKSGGRLPSTSWDD